VELDAPAVEFYLVDSRISDGWRGAELGLGRSNKDKQLHLLSAEGGEAFEALPVAIKN
jgi:hypothetical protein